MVVGCPQRMGTALILISSAQSLDRVSLTVSFLVVFGRNVWVDVIRFGSSVIQATYTKNIPSTTRTSAVVVAVADTSIACSLA